MELFDLGILLGGVGAILTGVGSILGAIFTGIRDANARIRRIIMGLIFVTFTMTLVAVVMGFLYLFS